MKKILLFTLMCLVGLFGNLKAQTPETITIGSGDEVTTNSPSYTDGYYSISQQIFLADEMQNMSGEITSIAFTCTKNPATRTFKIYMVNTDKSSFSNTNDWVSIQESDLVYEGTLTYSQVNSLTVINLDTPFKYNKGKNLLVCVNDVTGSIASTARYTAFSASNRCLWNYSWGSSAYDVTNPGSGRLYGMLNQVQFTIIPGNDEEPENPETPVDPDPEDPETPETPEDPETPTYTGKTFSYNFNNSSLEGWRTFKGENASEGSPDWQISPKIDNPYMQALNAYYLGKDNTDGIVSMAYNMISSTAYKPDNYIVTTKAYTITGTSKLSWYAKVPGGYATESEHYYVIVSEDNENWTTIFDELCPVGADREFDFAGTEYVGKDLYIGFRHLYVGSAQSSYDAVCLDEIQLTVGEGDEPVAPAAPQNLTATATGKAVALTWDATAETMYYNIYCDAVKVAENITATSYTVSGLEALTTYCFTVTAVNEAGESEASAEACATTEESDPEQPEDPEIPVANDTTFLFDFNDGTINGWNAFQSQGATGKGWITPQMNSYLPEIINSLQNYYKGVDGTTAVYSMSFDLYENESRNPNNFLVTEKAYLMTETSMLIWDIRETEAGKSDHYGIIISEDGNNFEILWDEFYGNTSGETKAISLAQYAGKTLYVGFLHYDQTKAGDALCLDNITLSVDSTIEPIDPTAPARPTNLKANATSTSSITLTWDSAANALSYNVYQNQEFVANVTETTYTMENLTAATTYCFTVTSVKGEFETEHSAESCATTFDVTPETPTNIEAEVLSKTAIKLTWDKMEHATAYNIYRGMMKIATVTEPTYTEEGLTANTEYCYILTSVNGELESGKSEAVCAKTKGESLSEIASSVKVYPNPAENNLFVETNVNIETISVYTITGVMVYNEQCTMNNVQLDITDLNSGVYFVKVMTNNGEIVKRIVKK